MTQFALEHPYVTTLILIVLICVTGDTITAFAKKKGTDE